MKRLISVLIVGCVSLWVTGCAESDEEKKFRQELVDKALNDEVRKQGDAFLAENAQIPDVVTTESGLQYKILVAGEGAKPSIHDVVKVHYEGMRVDGHIFDSSYQRGEPSTFPVKRVIRGWTEALLLMPKGSVWMLYVPPERAYGATSPTVEIPANSTLIFKVELIDFEPAEQ